MKIADLKNWIEYNTRDDIVTSIAPTGPGRDFVIVYLREEITALEKETIARNLPLGVKIQYEVEPPR